METMSTEQRAVLESLGNAERAVTTLMQKEEDEMLEPEDLSELIVAKLSIDHAIILLGGEIF